MQRPHLLAATAEMQAHQLLLRSTAYALRPCRPAVETAKSVTEIGFDEVIGVKVKHFEVVVDTAEAMKVSPQLQQQIDQLDADIPDELTYDVYVDEQNQIRRTKVEFSVGGENVSVDIFIKPTSEPIVIVVPDPADVTDFADVM